MKETIEQDFIFNQERRTATQAFRYVGLQPPGNISRLNIKNINPPYLVQQLKFDILNIQIDQKDGYEFSEAGRRIDARYILDVLRKYNLSYTKVNININHDFVLKENIDFKQLSTSIFKLSINFNNTMFYDTLLKGSFRRYHIRSGKSPYKLIVPRGTEIINNSKNNNVEFY